MRARCGQLRLRLPFGVHHHGGEYLSLSPGLNYTLARVWQACGYVQLPLYQHVNGVQLTADWSVVSGVSRRFR